MLRDHPEYEWSGEGMHNERGPRACDCEQEPHRYRTYYPAEKSMECNTPNGTAARRDCSARSSRR